MPEATAFTGAGIVLAVYLVLGGRTYCSWVCPINPITDLAAWLRRRFGIDKGLVMKPATRWWVLAMALVVSAATGTIAWELINPITAVWRAAVFGVGLGLMSARRDLPVRPVRRPQRLVRPCLPGRRVLRAPRQGHAAAGVGARARALRRLPRLLRRLPGKPRHRAGAARRQGAAHGPVILSGDCTACARCVDVCPERVFTLTHRFDRRLDEAPAATCHAAPDRARELAKAKV